MASIMDMCQLGSEPVKRLIAAQFTCAKGP